MTEVPMVASINCETKETTTRPMTAEEIAAREESIANALAREAERVAEEEAKAALKASAKAKLVAGTPLTEEEAATIVL
jgi:hypothetical protein